MSFLSRVPADTVPDVIQRGRTYHRQGRVIRLLRRGARYEASISGSQTYQLWLADTVQGWRGQCSCPYEGGGFCKHLVAAVCAIEAGEATQLPPEPAGLAPAPGFVQSVFEAAPPWARAAFLTELFHRQPALRAAFEALQKGAAPWPPQLKVGAAARELRAQMETRPEQAAATLDRFWAPWAGFAGEGDAGNALRLYLAAYEALAGLAEHTAWLQARATETKAFLQARMHSLPRSKHLIALVIQRWDAYEKAGEAFRYHLPDFIPFFQAIIAHPVPARYLRLQLEAYGLQQRPDLAALQAYLEQWEPA